MAGSYFDVSGGMDLCIGQYCWRQKQKNKKKSRCNLGGQSCFHVLRRVVHTLKCSPYALCFVIAAPHPPRSTGYGTQRKKQNTACIKGSRAFPPPGINVEVQKTDGHNPRRARSNTESTPAASTRINLLCPQTYFLCTVEKLYYEVLNSSIQTEKCMLLLGYAVLRRRFHVAGTGAALRIKYGSAVGNYLRNTPYVSCTSGHARPLAWAAVPPPWHLQIYVLNLFVGPFNGTAS